MQESLDAFRLDMTRAYTTPAPMPMPMPCCVWAGRRLRRMAHPYVNNLYRYLIDDFARLLFCIRYNSLWNGWSVRSL